MPETLTDEQFDLIIRHSVLDSSFVPDELTTKQLAEYLIQRDSSLKPKIERILRLSETNLIFAHDELSILLLAERRRRKAD